MGKLVLLIMLLAVPALAVPPSAQEADAYAFDQKPGSQLPLDAPFTDAAGRPSSLRALGGKPLVLAFGYFHCPNLCGVVREDMFAALERTGLTAGVDYQLAFVSIDPSETMPPMPSTVTDDLARYPTARSQTGGDQTAHSQTAHSQTGGDQIGDDGWHFLTGPATSIDAVTAAAGYRSKFDPALSQFMHPAGLVFATPGE